MYIPGYIRIPFQLIWTDKRNSKFDGHETPVSGQAIVMSVQINPNNIRFRKASRFKSQLEIVGKLVSIFPKTECSSKPNNTLNYSM